MDFKTIKCINKISDSLHDTGTSARNVSRNLRELCISMVEAKKLLLPQEIFGSSKICIKCWTPWSEGQFSLRVVASKISNRKNRKKSLTKLLKKDSTKLNKFQAGFLHRISTHKNNLMRIRCLVCKSLTKLSLNKAEPFKSSKKLKEQKIQSNVNYSDETPIKKKKKKKKKDTLCGLKVSAVAQVKKNKSQSAIDNKLKKSNVTLNLEMNALNTSRKDSISFKDSDLSLKVKNIDVETKLSFTKHGRINQTKENEKIINLTQKPKIQIISDSEIKDYNISNSPVTNYLKSGATDNAHKNYVCSASEVDTSEHVRNQSSLSLENSKTCVLTKYGNKSDITKKSNKICLSETLTNNNKFNNKGSTNNLESGIIFGKDNKNSDDKKISLLSQPSSHNILQRNNNYTYLNKINVNSKTVNLINNDKSSKRQIKSSTLNKINEGNNKVNKLSNTNSPSLIDNNHLQKKNSNKKKKNKNKKSKDKSISKRISKVFVESNCTNSLCVQDLLNLT